MRPLLFNSMGLCCIFIGFDGPVDNLNLPRICQSSHGLPVRSAEPGVVGTDRLPAYTPFLKRQCQIICAGVNIQAGICQKILRFNSVLRQLHMVLRIDLHQSGTVACPAISKQSAAIDELENKKRVNASAIPFMVIPPGPDAGITLTHPRCRLNKYALLTTKSPHPTQN